MPFKPRKDQLPKNNYFLKLFSWNPERKIKGPA